MVNLHVVDFTSNGDDLKSITYVTSKDTTITKSVGTDVDVQANKTATVSANGTQVITPASNYDAMAKVTLTVAIKLYAYKATGGAVVYLNAIPSADAESVSVYIPTDTALTTGTGSYTAETTTVTVSDVDYVRYADGDITI